MAEVTSVSEVMDETAAVIDAVPMSASTGDTDFAETDGHTLWFGTAFVNNIARDAGEDGVRFIVAHELGHQAGGMEVTGHKAEFMADDYAARAVARMGGEFSSIESVFTHMPDPHDSPTHPSTSQRLAHARAAFENEPKKSEVLHIPKGTASREIPDLAIG